jgi:hypothetical protein
VTRPQRASPLPSGERSVVERSETIRVRGYDLSIGSNPSPAAFGVDLPLWER